MTINNQNLCEFCFDPLPLESDVCPSCSGERNISKYPTALSEGSILAGKYFVGKVLGKGGFGITYLCFDIRNNKKVAIKEYLPDSLSHRNSGESTVSTYGGDKDNLFKNGAQKFFDEARLVSHFNGNPNIISVYEFFYENNTTYFVMEYLSGMDMKAYLKANSKIPEGEAVYIAKRAIDALLIVHSTNTLHRDIAPDNIFLCDDGSVKLIDFGASRHIIANESNSLSVILKHGYAPFEQYQTKGKQGPWTDIYALGVTLYTSVTGIMPDEAMSRLEDPSLDMTGVSPEFAAVLTKMMAVKAEDRYQNIVALKADFDSLPIVPVAPTIKSNKKQRYCTNCGAEIEPWQKLCEKCTSALVLTTARVTTPKKPVVKNKKSNTGLIVALCSAGALLVAAIIVIVILLAGSTKGGYYSDQGSNSGENIQGNTGSDYTDITNLGHEHVFEDYTVINVATCTEDGLLRYTCSVQYCNVTKDVVVDKVPHNYSNVEITKNPTTTSEGERTYYCSCGAIKKESIPKLSSDHTHSYENPTVVKEATCTSEGEQILTCSCGETKTETIAKTAHKYSWSKITKEATCTSTGVRTYYCTCGAVSGTETIAKIDHNYTDPVVIKAPTTTSEGEQKLTCSCGATTIRKIAKLEGSSVDNAIALLENKQYSAALTEFKKLAEEGDVTAQFYYGYCLMSAFGTDEDRPKACEWLQKAADKNNAEAQYYLASAYMEGNGVYRDQAKAFALYKKSADSGYLPAKIALGIAYYEGNGVKKDVSVASKYVYENINALTKEAEGGDFEAQTLLGYLCLNGYGVSEDIENAKMWYKKAADNGYVKAQGLYADLCYYYVEDFASAITYSKMASDRGAAYAKVILALCYYNGKGTKSNPYFATEVLLQAAEKNCLDAQYTVAQCYYYGDAVAKNYFVAFEYYSLAAKHNLAEAQNMVGRCYEEGWGVGQDYFMAVEWYTKAADQGNLVAIYNLAYCVYYGYGTTSDRDAAIDLFKHVVKYGDPELAEMAQEWLDYIS